MPLKSNRDGKKSKKQVYDMNEDISRELARLERLRAEIAKERERPHRQNTTYKCAATVMFIGAGVLALPAIALATAARIVAKRGK